MFKIGAYSKKSGQDGEKTRNHVYRRKNWRNVDVYSGGEGTELLSSWIERAVM